MRIKRLLFLLAALAISLPLFSQEYVGDSCTTLLVGKKASSDGSMMTSHTCDGRYRAWQALEDKYWLQFGMGLHNRYRSIPGGQGGRPRWARSIIIPTSLPT